MSGIDKTVQEYYYNKLAALKLNRSTGRPSPHKVCLLLAIFDLIQEGHPNRFTLSDALNERFQYYFNKLKQGRDACDIAKPFYHLKSDGIWHFSIVDANKFSALETTKKTLSQKQIREHIEFAYLDISLFQLLQDRQQRALLRDRVMENLEDLSEAFQRWLLQIGKSEKTAKSYSQAIKGRISSWAEEADICEQNLITIQSYTQLHRIAEGLGKYEPFVTQNTKGNSMYSSALNAYKEFLSDIGQVKVTEDIDQIISDKTLDETQKSRLVNTRIGQGEFRQKLISYWGGCAVTGYKTPQLLVASHIKPWRASDNHERLSKYNGLLLLPNLDKAFDLGFISFSDKGKIMLSDSIESPETLGVHSDMRIELSHNHGEFMAYHREKVFNC